MSVRVVPHEGNRWEVDIRVRLADGTSHREKKVLDQSKTIAKRWAEDRERHLLQHGLPTMKKEVPTLTMFAPRFIDGHANANQHKPSGIAHKQTVIDVHLVPNLGTKPLDEISSEDVQQLKSRLTGKKPKTVNNVLTVLSKLLKVAVEWGVIERMPCTIRLLKPSKDSKAYWDFEQYERLVAAAEALGPNAHLAVLLGGDAGLRAGEMRALEWADIDVARQRLKVERSAWRDKVTSTKGNRVRYVPLTERLARALKQHRHLRGRRVICQPDGRPLQPNELAYVVQQSAQKAGLVNGRKAPGAGPHVLRHTFCSHLAMRGAPAGSIQALAGHRDLATTQGYMHLGPMATEHAIRLLDHRTTDADRGAQGEAADA